MLPKLPKLPRLDAPLGAEFFGLVDLRFGVGVAHGFFFLFIKDNLLLLSFLLSLFT
jgi:hypothetical protein